MVELEVDDSLLTEAGGYLEVTAIAHDHQGIETISSAYIECPDLNPALIEGTVLWEDDINQMRAYGFIVSNVNGTAIAGDEVQFLVKVNPIEEIHLYAFNASTATVHESSGDCPADVHDTFFGQGEFGTFGNFPIPPYDAAIIASGPRATEFIMCGNGFAGSMLGSYDISDLGPHDANGFVGLIGTGGPTSLDTANNTDHVFLVMQNPIPEGSIMIYDTLGSGLIDSLTMPQVVSCAEITPNEDIWYICQAGSYITMHHAGLISEWDWEPIPDDSQQILNDLPATTDVFDLVYEPITQRIYVYHSYANGTITVYDASSPGPPVEMPDLTFEAIWGYSGPLEYFQGGTFNHGADIEIDHVDDTLSNCRIVVFANFELGGSSVLKLDADMNFLDFEQLSGGPYSTFAISTEPDISKRRLVFLPLYDFNKDYYLFDAPVGW
jgi:hypothetical protein